MYFENNEIYNNIVVLILRYVNYRNLFQLYRDEMNRNLKKKTIYYNCTINIKFISNYFPFAFINSLLYHYYILYLIAIFKIFFIYHF